MPNSCYIEKKKIFIYSSFHFPSPHIYHATVWLREHGHKPQKQREMSCLLSSKEVWLLHDVSMALKGIKRFRIQGIADRLRQKF